MRQPNRPKSSTRAGSLEQDLLWSVLDQAAVPAIIEMARRNWKLDAAAAWQALVRQARLGHLQAYRGTGPFITVDLTQTSFDEAAHDHGLFVEPTAATHARLRQIGKRAAID